MIRAAVEIDQNDPLGIIYQHSLFCQVATAQPAGGRVFERAYRNGSIRMHAGELWDGTRWIEQPLPCRPKPRLALCHLNSEAVKTRCPVVEVDRSARKFMERLGLNTDGGSTLQPVQAEMKALASRLPDDAGLRRRGPPHHRGREADSAFRGVVGPRKKGSQLSGPEPSNCRRSISIAC